MKTTFLAAIALMVTTGAQADDYMLNVPVNVSNLKLGAGLQLSCRLCTDPDSRRCTESGQYARSVARTSMPVPLVNGNYSGTMQVVFRNVGQGTGRQSGSSSHPDIKSYGCDFLSPGNIDHGIPALDSTLVKPNSNSVTTISGNLQQPAKP